jgi:hypothetical protein
MVGIKTTGEQIAILCHNGTIFDKPREKTGLAIKRHVGVRENHAANGIRGETTRIPLWNT